MTKETHFAVWAPTGSLWSPWVKPVLFACMTASDPEGELEIPKPPAWWPPASAGTVVVLDLPGELGVLWGLAGARTGYRPVPLYNALPWAESPVGTNARNRSSLAARPLINVHPIMEALQRGTGTLQQCAPSPHAPPVFLLDANRRNAPDGSPGDFDNRSVSFATDFPSARFLKENNLHQALLIQMRGHQPQADLAHPLRRWQEGGLALSVKALEEDCGPSSMAVERPSRFGAVWYRALAALGLRRHELGGYGGVIPDPESSWGSGG